MSNSVKRWVYVLNVLRAIPYTDYNELTMEVEVNLLMFHTNDDSSLDVLDASTGENLITFAEGGLPTYLSDWAQEPVQWGAYDYPMYERPYIEDLKTIAWSIGSGQKVLICHEGIDLTVDTTGEYIEVIDPLTNRVILKLGYNEEYTYEEE